MLKRKEPNGNVVYNPACVWCNGSGFTHVPDYNTVSECGYYDRIMAGDVPQHAVVCAIATSAILSHRCARAKFAIRICLTTLTLSNLAEFPARWKY